MEKDITISIQQFVFGSGFETKLDFVTPGLLLNVKGAYNSDYATTKQRSSSKHITIP